MRRMIFGLIELAMNVSDPRAASSVFLVLMIILMSLPAFYFSYRSGYLQGKKELLDAINEANDTTFGINVALRKIDPLEIIQEEE